MTSTTGDEVLTDQRLEDLERFRDIEFKTWREDLERRFAEAFPGGDHVGHCRYHQLMIERNIELRRLRQAIIEKTIGGLVWGLLLGLGIAVLNYLKVLVKGGG